MGKLSLYTWSVICNKLMYFYYPDCGQPRCKLIFNQKVNPHLSLKTSDDLHIHFCYEGAVVPGTAFKPNHIVPLVFGAAEGKKRLRVEFVMFLWKTQVVTLYLNVLSFYLSLNPWFLLVVLLLH